MSLISLDFLVYLGQIRKQISTFVADLVIFLPKFGKALNNPPLFRKKQFIEKALNKLLTFYPCSIRKKHA
jgi:hypothetical protein